MHTVAADVRFWHGRKTACIQGFKLQRELSLGHCDYLELAPIVKLSLVLQHFCSWNRNKESEDGLQKFWRDWLSSLT